MPTVNKRQSHIIFLKYINIKLIIINYSGLFENLNLAKRSFSREKLYNSNRSR